MSAVVDAIGPVRLGLIVWYVIASAAVFALYGRDKRAAQRGRWRTPENTLHLMSLLGGWPGALIARRVFRHKTRKQPFRAIFWATVIVNLAMLLWLLGWILPTLMN